MMMFLRTKLILLAALVAIAASASVELADVSSRYGASDAPLTAKPATTLFLHGLNGNAGQFNTMMGRMNATFGANAPAMHSLPLFESSASLETPLATQRDAIVAYLCQNAESLDLAGGFNFVAHSQGALLARTVIQALPSNFTVKALISMAGPQLGQWGMCPMAKQFLNSSIIKGLTRDAGWLALYNSIAQAHLSFANYWNDPNHQTMFADFNHFLPVHNNLVDHPDSAAYKDAFLRIERGVFLGSDGDDCISPPLSTVFQFLDTSDAVVQMEATREYKEDTFGLKTLDERGGLVLGSPPGHNHNSWLGDEQLFNKYVAPNLL